MRGWLVGFVLLFVLLFSFLWFNRPYNWFIQKMCDEPTGVRKEFIDRINKQYQGQLIVKQVPCYADYLELRCKKNVSKEIMDRIDSSAATLDWIETLIYNEKDSLIRGETGSM